MNITCPHCRAKLNLPDDKVPRDRDSSFKCPKCRETIQLKSGQAAESVAGGAPGPISHMTDALVCVADAGVRSRVMAAAKAAGWAAESAVSQDQALGRLEYQSFPLMVMDDGFDADGRMIRYLNALDMSLRRRSCLVLFKRETRTGDAMAALHSSCNFVINPSDVSRADDVFVQGLLTAALADHENFYRVYNESMRATGKA